MTGHLRVVDESFVANDTHGLRAVELSPEDVADLEALASHVLMPARVACRELEDALARRNRDGAIAASRRLLAVGLLAGDKTRQMESE